MTTSAKKMMRDSGRIARLLELGKISNNTFDIAETLSKLKSIAKSLHRIAENDCNGHPREVSEIRDGKLFRYSVEDTEWLRRDERREERLKKKAIELIQAMDIQKSHVDFQGDPRGAVMKLYLNEVDFTDLLY